MKTSFILTTICLLGLSALIVYSKFEHINTGNITVAIREDDDTYRMTASYNPENTRKVQRYINHSIAPNGLFKSENDYFNVSTTLADKTDFHVKESPGHLEIELDKRRNSTASYYRIKKMCDGIKGLLTTK